MDEEPSGWQAFRAEIGDRMTGEHAAAVERMRVERALTWSGVAESFYDEFPDELYDRRSRGNSGVGAILCEIAAERLQRAID